MLSLSCVGVGEVASLEVWWDVGPGAVAKISGHLDRREGRWKPRRRFARWWPVKSARAASRLQQRNYSSRGNAGSGQRDATDRDGGMTGADVIGLDIKMFENVGKEGFCRIMNAAGHLFNVKGQRSSLVKSRKTPVSASFTLATSTPLNRPQLPYNNGMLIQRGPRHTLLLCTFRNSSFITLMPCFPLPLPGSVPTAP